MTGNELMFIEGYDCLRSKIVTLDRSFQKETLISSKIEVGAVETLTRLEGMK